jgi:hypothetical protein
MPRSSFKGDGSGLKLAKRTLPQAEMSSDELSRRHAANANCAMNAIGELDKECREPLASQMGPSLVGGLLDYGTAGQAE